jgi:predicted NAD-dependent protein-ADP-ribosyltransferase YbiA (DUF1768 family)
MADKVKTTDTHVYFLTGPFSQWHLSKFSVPALRNGITVIEEYNCAEQYMMARKAEFFGDEEIRQAIMDVKVPEGGIFTCFRTPHVLSAQQL